LEGKGLMKKITHTLGLAMVVAAASVAGAQATARVAVAPTTKLWIEGTSNVHDWKCSASDLGNAIVIAVDAVAPATTAPAKLVRTVDVKIPVRSLKCGNGKMDDNLYKALKANDHTEIVYSLVSTETIGDSLRAKGKLTIAGVTNELTMDLDATRLPDGSLKASGTVPVKMTAFGVKPPSALLGAIKTGDEVKVKFELVVGQKVVAAIDK
jgi:polyisoprenoid-binding protein YceI